MEDKILLEITKLHEIIKKYERLDSVKYQWRINGIYDQVEALEAVLNGNSIADTWEQCFKEDEKAGK